MATSEIDKLERRYAENPQGLTFAPLAEVYRKNGDIPRALELLGPGLERHPEYVPAHIVLGRCRLDLGELPEAEQAFTAVLGLDGENVIALKALADINERLGRYDDAERWLQSLLAVDRNNPGAQEQLVRLEAAKMQTGLGTGSEDADAELENDVTPAAVAAELVAEADADVGAGAAVEEAEEIVDVASGVELEALPEPVLETVAEVTTWTAEVEAAPTDDPAMLVIDDELAPPAEPVAPVEGAELVEEVTLADEDVEVLPGLVTPDSPSLRHELAEPVSADDDEMFRIETADELVLRPSGASEFQMPDASQDLVAARPEPDPLAPTPTQVDEMPMPAVVEESAMPPVEEEAEPAAPAVVEEAEAVAPEVVEMAEVVEVEAAATPAAPAESADDLALPGDDLASSEPVTVVAAPEVDVPEAAASEADALEADAAVQAAAAPEAVVESGEDDAAAEPAPIVTETMAEVLLRQGYTADALLIYRELQRRSGGDPRLADKIAALEAQTAPVAARPPAYTARETGGQSVHDFFRVLLAARITGPMAPASSTAATTAATAAPAGSTRPATDGLSLSAVFGEEASPVPPAVPAGSAAEPSFDAFFGTAGGTAGTGRAARAPEAKDDDLDQFHAWLQNLKR